ncbi:MAG: S26 family signal peptidase [Thiotrichales bacterium]|nr:S26 family signal peptidase [Thiotrichales bacterium]
MTLRLRRAHFVSADALRAKARVRRRARCVLAAFAALAVLWLGVASRVHVNASWSDPAWGYVLLPTGTPIHGDQVVFDPPAALGAPAPYLKTVRGLPGDRVTVGPDRMVAVNGLPLGRAKPHARDGRPLQPITPGTVPAGHYFVHGAHLDSHDSRYAEVGLIPHAALRGRALALPDLPWLGLAGPLVGPEAVAVTAETRP